MPEFLPPDTVRFEFQDGLPSLHLDVSVPDGGADGPWGLLSRATLCVVDGPGEAGYLVARMPPGSVSVPEGWDEAVERAGGCLVVFSRSPDVAPLFAGSVG